METTIPQNIIQPLELLIYLSMISLVVIVTFLAKLLWDSIKLVKSLKDFSDVTQAELEPTIKEINGTLSNINKISSNFNNQITNINDGLEKGGRLLSSCSEKAIKKLKVIGSGAKEIVKAVTEVLTK